MPTIHNNVFDAGLEHISTNASEAEVHSASATVLVDGISLNASNFDAPKDNTGVGGGRKMFCLVEEGTDMSNISVDVAGNATKVVIKNGVGDILVTTTLTASPVSLGGDDSVSLGTFSVIFKDPI